MTNTAIISWSQIVITLYKLNITSYNRVAFSNRLLLSSKYIMAYLICELHIYTQTQIWVIKLHICTIYVKILNYMYILQINIIIYINNFNLQNYQ